MQCFAFSGYKVSVVSLEPGGRLYTCTAGGQILAPDVPSVYLEVRETSRSSTDARGSDAYEVEFRYRDGREFLVVCKRLRAAEVEAKQRAKQAQIAIAEVDIQELVLSHVPIQAPPMLEQFSSICIGNLPVEHETLVFLHLVKIKAVRAFEAALTRKGQLLQVFPQMHLQYRSEEESRRMVTRATEIGEVYTATIDVSRVLIDQVEMAVLQLAIQIVQKYEISDTDARPDALDQAQLLVRCDEKVCGVEGSRLGPATAALTCLAPVAGSSTQGPQIP